MVKFSEMDLPWKFSKKHQSIDRPYGWFWAILRETIEFLLLTIFTINIKIVIVHAMLYVCLSMDIINKKLNNIE